MTPSPPPLQAGAVIIKQGSPGHKFYIVERGEVVITKRFTPTQPPQEVRRRSRPVPACAASQRTMQVLRVSSGHYFGEIALLTSKPRQATATAATDTMCLTLDRSTFQRVMGPLTDILKRDMDKYNLVIGQQI